ncbi:hypothetical protein [Novosphingobium pentaromativorans]|uniref:Diguanylate cyclase n=1 Tax=Novosphingobium pentaromativorans US6-1 TaxID=1088721 RepID=G6EAX6_9SPHN|nr:hypothetical protein [Novosphingobium pentaromativorans]EHJ61539.1 diguanylate cyclase [Novosphingobium pentaromativorans US6-1]
MRFLSGGRPESDSSSEQAFAQAKTGEGNLSARDLVRRQLIEDIGEFLIGNDLDISEPNLSAALG